MQSALSVENPALSETLRSTLRLSPVARIGPWTDHHGMSDKSSTAQATFERRPAPEIQGERLQSSRDDRGTIDVDVPAVAAALSQRLYAAGVPVTPERAVNLAQALNLVRPVSRRCLYYTARAVFVSAPAQLPAFDRVFASVFGGYPDGDDCAPNAECAGPCDT